MITRKPLFRWSIGDISTKESFFVLKESVKFLKKTYQNNFEYAICYNIKDNIKFKFLQEISNKYEVKLIEQNWKDAPIPDNIPNFNQKSFIDSSKQSGSLWKYCPNRISEDSHEIFIDNDVIITKKIKVIDDFLNDNLVLLSKDNTRFFGRYDFLHQEKVAYNSGIIGLPPFYDLHKRIYKVWNNYKLYNLSFADEQGLVTFVLSNEKHFLIDTNEVGIFHYDYYFDGQNKINYSKINFSKFKGFHFVGINRRKKHEGWNHYNNLKLN